MISLVQRLVARFCYLSGSGFLMGVAAALTTRVVAKARGATKLRILALSAHRFRGDLDILASQGMEMLAADDRWMTAPLGYFYRGLPMALKDHHSPEADTPSYAAQQKLRCYLRSMLNWMFRIRPVDAVISAMTHYPQDCHCGAAAEEIGVAYVVLHRAGVIANRGSEDALMKRYSELGTFRGRAILVSNSRIRDILMRSGFAAADQIHIVGSPRLAPFIQATEKAGTARKGQRHVTLFSFTHNIGRVITARELGLPGSADWTDDPQQGVVRYFDEVHGALGQFARDNPSVNVTIKLKWAGEWKERVERAIRAKDIEPDHLTNLSILEGVSADNLVLDSDVIVAFGSTTILEAGLAKKPVIVPVFAEVAEPDYEPFFPMKDCLEGVDVAHSPEELLKLIADRLEHWAASPDIETIRRKNFETYLGPIDCTLAASTAQLIEHLVTSAP